MRFSIEMDSLKLIYCLNTFETKPFFHLCKFKFPSNRNGPTKRTSYGSQKS